MVAVLTGSRKSLVDERTFEFAPSRSGNIKIIPYTRVNKCILQGNMHLIPLIAKGKIGHTSKTVMPSLVAHVHDSK